MNAVGKEMMELHTDYESAVAYILVEKKIAAKATPKSKLKPLKEKGVIQIDENTELHNVPSLAWKYILGNRSAIEWVLDQYKEKKKGDVTVNKKFNTYCLQNCKEELIKLLKKVCTVGVKTMEIIDAMPLQ